MNRLVLCILAAALLASSFGVVGAQQQPAAEPAAVAAVEPAAPSANSLIFSKLEWVISDMTRCIEELRLAADDKSKRLLVEQMEQMLYEEVEFPLWYQQADNADPLDVSNIGVASDVVDSGQANPLAPLYAEAFALMGIAKGYEGFAAAANDYISRAQRMYSDVLSIKVRIDSFAVPQELQQWVLDAQGRWGATNTVRITLHGKAVAQEVVDSLNLDKVQFATDPPGRRESDYYLQVAESDFLHGMRRYVITDDLLTRKRSNVFQLYLPPGRYRLSTGVSPDYATLIEVHDNPNLNQYLVETLEQGIAVYPVPNARELGSGPELKPGAATLPASSGGTDAAD